jgi:hypothetical protein
MRGKVTLKERENGEKIQRKLAGFDSDNVKYISLVCYILFEKKNHQTITQLNTNLL